MSFEANEDSLDLEHLLINIWVHIEISENTVRDRIEIINISGVFFLKGNIWEVGDSGCFPFNLIAV